MKRIIIKSIPLFLVCIFAQSGFSMTGRQIMQKNDALPEENTAFKQNILLIVKNGKTEKKEFSSTLKRYGQKTRNRMAFTYPTRVEFLVWDTPGKDSIQWIKLTSGKVRKIASSDKDKPWMNSHFYYEDIGEKDLDDYRYKLLGEAYVKGKKCYKIESVKVKGTRVYSKTVVYVGTEDFLKYRIDFYLRGRHVKTLFFEKRKKISGIDTVRKAIMTRTDGKGKTIMYLRSVNYNQPVSDKILKREGLR